MNKFTKQLSIIGLASAIALVSGCNQSSQASTSKKPSNFDGSYTIDYGQATCGNLGHQFKLKHEKDGYSSSSKMHKSNCRVASNGLFEGYIYPKTHPHMRIHWLQTKNGIVYKD